MHNTLIQSLETRRLFVVDLACLGVTINSYDAASGDLSITVRVTNTGLSPIPDGTVNKIFLSTDQQVNNSDDITIGSISSKQIPNSGDIATIPLTFNVQSRPTGNYFVGVALDSDNTVDEPDNLNNFRFSSSQITVNETFDLVVNGTAGKDYIAAQQANGKISIYMNGVLDRSVDSDRVKTLTILGNAGNDTILVSSLAMPARVEGGDGKDNITGSVMADTLIGNAGPDVIHGGGGNDLIRGNGGNDSLYGESGADRLFGDAGNDSIDGGSSADRIDGGAGTDTLYGQGGDDRFFAKDGTFDLIHGGSGYDTAIKDSIDSVLSISP